MTAGLTIWWQRLSRRERRLVLAMLAVALPVLLWLAVLRPLGAAREAALLRLETASRAQADVTAAGAAIRAAEARAGQGGGEAALTERVRQAVAAAGLASESLEQDGNGQVTLRIAAARAPVLLGLAATLEAGGMIVQTLSISRNDDTTVSARLTVSEGGR
ncbi:type II secretion system protein GspM [Polymorphobacter sp.]|uniref:type II secretion system protein GspM n=1 Tax=Polymorphobacter sp. TaxID=1909290 RepID=UPI003F721496